MSIEISNTDLAKAAYEVCSLAACVIAGRKVTMGAGYKIGSALAHFTDKEKAADWNKKGDEYLDPQKKISVPI